MRGVEAVLFDLDGVLIDSFESWYQAFNAMLRRYRGEELSRDEFRARCWGPDLRDNLREWHLDEEAGRYCIAEQLELVELIKLFPGAREVLTHIRDRYRAKIKVGLVTNTPRRNVARILEHFQLAHLFDVVITGDDVHRGKPDAEMVIEACTRLNVKPENAILVGDTESDFWAGKSAGCAVIAVGTRIPGELEQELEMHIENLYELIDILNDLNDACNPYFSRSGT